MVVYKCNRITCQLANPLQVALDAWGLHVDFASGNLRFVI
jgi:hypothetical protein